MILPKIDYDGTIRYFQTLDIGMDNYMRTNLLKLTHFKLFQNKYFRAG